MYVSDYSVYGLKQCVVPESSKGWLCRVGVTVREGDKQTGVMEVRGEKPHQAKYTPIKRKKRRKKTSKPCTENRCALVLHWSTCVCGQCPAAVEKSCLPSQADMQYVSI